MLDKTKDDEEPEPSNAQWDADNRHPWQRHSELGQNLNAEGTAKTEEHMEAAINQVYYNWSGRWKDISVSKNASELGRSKAARSGV